MSPGRFLQTWKFPLLGLAAAIALSVGLALAGAFRSHFPGEDMEIPAADLPRVVSAANAGSIEAAGRLCNHYLFFVDDESKAMVWARRAAELGSATYQDFMIDTLAQSLEVGDRNEAKTLESRWHRPHPDL
jgi:TPR repeat protein